MNSEAIGAIGQVLGSIAVFATLGYLAVQVKYARSETRRALSQGRVEALRDLLAQSADERMGRLMVKANGTFNQRQYGDGQWNIQRPAWLTELMDQAGPTSEDANSLFLFQGSMVELPRPDHHPHH